MKIRVLSDIHIDYERREADKVDPSTGGKIDDELDFYGDLGEDVVVLAGDIDEGIQGIEWAVRRFGGRATIIYVPGNHEYYGWKINGIRPYFEQFEAELREKGIDIHILDRRSCIVDGVRFVGATLWTDFALNGNQSEGMKHAAEGVNDSKFIGFNTGATEVPFTPDLALQEHVADLAFLDQELSKPFEGETIVVTHHAPSRLGIQQQYALDPANTAYASNLDHFIEKHKPVFWFFGHTHGSTDVVIGSTRVVGNPRGLWPKYLNPRFRADALYEVPSPVSAPEPPQEGASPA